MKIKLKEKPYSLKFDDLKAGDCFYADDDLKAGDCFYADTDNLYMKADTDNLYMKINPYGKYNAVNVKYGDLVGIEETKIIIKFECELVEL